MPPHIEEIEVKPFLELSREKRMAISKDTQEVVDRITHLVMVGFWIELSLDVAVNLGEPETNQV